MIMTKDIYINSRNHNYIFKPEIPTQSNHIPPKVRTKEIVGSIMKNVLFHWSKKKKKINRDKIKNKIVREIT